MTRNGFISPRSFVAADVRRRNRSRYEPSASLRRRLRAQGDPSRSGLQAFRILVCLLAGVIWGGGGQCHAGQGDEVVVVYNTRLAESREVALHYAARREIPTNQIFGFDLPVAETMSRAEFHDQLQKPLLKALEGQRLFVVSADIKPVGRREPGEVRQKLTSAAIRYAVLCYGVPVSIARDLTLVEPGLDKAPEQLRANEAAVDSELALLPAYWRELRLFGPLSNPLLGATNAAALNPMNGVLMVARLDGPTSEIARGLVDKAMDAETNGLWGRAYFDARGLTNGNYQTGDNWILGAAEVIRRMGFETVVDTRPETFGAAFPMSQIALYAGWYDGNASGPFSRSKVEFMPGAVAYHLHSFSAHSIRTANQYWVGPLLAAGVTATMGYVFEPYLEGTADIAVFFSRLLVSGFSFGEAAYASQSALSWQTTVVGDPLYRPFGRRNPGENFGARLQQLHFQLLARRSKRIEWSNLQVANLNLVAGYPVQEVIAYLEAEPTTRQSAVLQEKLAGLYDSQGKLADAIETYERAAKLEATPQQRSRILLALAANLALFKQEEKAVGLYEQFLREFPDYPDPLAIHQRMLTLAKELNRTADAERIQKEIERLTPAPKKE